MKKLAVQFFFTLWATLLLSLSTSCDSDNDTQLNNGDYIIFGHYYGECIGNNCVLNYKLTADKLYEDTNHNYAGNGEFSFTEMSNESYIRVKHILSLLPDELLQSDSQTFGCPDCADQGGMLIQLRKDGSTKTWRIDQDEAALPEYLHTVIDTINGCIGALHEYAAL
ncbi:MAG: hypothetical protein KBB11_02475 [Bacteroidales bacterium]|nr:hypothetical protein [Bacteroidales bacterium]HQP03355.1 hypothetical protein [Bacteroidales bacterium]